MCNLYFLFAWQWLLLSQLPFIKQAEENKASAGLSLPLRSFYYESYSRWFISLLSAWPRTVDYHNHTSIKCMPFSVNQSPTYASFAWRENMLCHIYNATMQTGACVEYIHQMAFSMSHKISIFSCNVIPLGLLHQTMIDLSLHDELLTYMKYTHTDLYLM